MTIRKLQCGCIVKRHQGKYKGTEFAVFCTQHTPRQHGEKQSILPTIVDDYLLITLLEELE